MRVIVLIACTFIAAAVFGAMFLSLWSTRELSEGEPRLRQSRMAEIIWAVIPCLMMVAAALPAAIAILARSTH
jgi:heme/copper-type cytochrome/quinol oxidase subunit 2